MRSKKLSRQLKNAFASPLDEASLPSVADWLRALPENSERDFLLAMTEGLPELLKQVDQSYVQGDERVDMAQRSLEVSSKELTESNKNLFSLNQTFDAMVNSLGQGFFLFNKEGVCLPIYSKVCETLLETVPKGSTLPDVLKISDAKRTGFLDWCSMLFEEIMEFDELAVLGPKFFPHSQGKVVALEFKPVRNPSGSIDAVVVIATDKTQEVEATRKAAELQAYASLVVSILRDRPRFAQFIRHSRNFFLEMHELVKSPNFSSESLTLVKRHLHTLKGASGTFGMIKVKEQVHEIETDVTKLHGMVEVQAFLKTAVPIVEDLFESLLIENREVIGDIVQGSGATREIPVASLERFAGTLLEEPMLPGKSLFESFVQEIMCVPLWKTMNPFNKILQETAIATRKKVEPLQFVGANPNILPEAYELVWESMSHLFRNMVDHGIEATALRKEVKKPEAGRVTITTNVTEAKDSSSSGTLVIRVSDDGRGVDPESIRRKLVSSGHENAQSMTADQLIQQIFAPGFSTATKVTEISGRGVGLDAVRGTIEGMGGTISVESALGRGTTFVMKMPLIQAPGEPLTPATDSRLTLVS